MQMLRCRDLPGDPKHDPKRTARPLTASKPRLRKASGPNGGVRNDPSGLVGAGEMVLLSLTLLEGRMLGPDSPVSSWRAPENRGVHLGRHGPPGSPALWHALTSRPAPHPLRAPARPTTTQLTRLPRSGFVQAIGFGPPVFLCRPPFAPPSLPPWRQGPPPRSSRLRRRSSRHTPPIGHRHCTCATLAR